jgi:hypothetical protein
MKVTVYIEKNNFDDFFTWMNRLNDGNFSTPPVEFSHREDEIQDPLKILLDSRDYTLIREAKQNMDEIQKAYGDFDAIFSPETFDDHLLIIQDILREAQRRDLLTEVVFTALQVATQIRGLNPDEAIIFAEKQHLKSIQDPFTKDI